MIFLSSKSYSFLLLSAPGLYLIHLFPLKEAHHIAQQAHYFEIQTPLIFLHFFLWCVPYLTSMNCSLQCTKLTREFPWSNHPMCFHLFCLHCQLFSGVLNHLNGHHLFVGALCCSLSSLPEFYMTLKKKQ